MYVDILLLAALAGIAVVFSLGVLVSKDNFYSALFMSVTQVFVATVYAFFNLQPVFVLLLFIFVGAIGIVTVALAATYRSEPERQVSWLWVLPVFLTVLIIGSAVSSNLIYAPQPISPGTIAFELMDFLPVAEYLLIIVALISLVVLLLLSVLKMGVGGRS
jgi:NADH:ubiquinone oxidoreductase subunit 6 (subunit J)